jgi:hypothetical protein
MIRHRPADWVMRHLVGEATPELELLREGAALCGSSVSRKYSAICAECPVGALLGCSLSVIAIVRAQGLSPRCPDRQDRTVQDPPLSSE